eukprot:16445672-Heterocapsa_arctica.AAC.1
MGRGRDPATLGRHAWLVLPPAVVDVVLQAELVSQRTEARAFLPEVAGAGQSMAAELAGRRVALPVAVPRWRPHAARPPEAEAQRVLGAEVSSPSLPTFVALRLDVHKLHALGVLAAREGRVQESHPSDDPERVEAPVRVGLEGARGIAVASRLRDCRQDAGVLEGVGREEGAPVGAAGNHAQAEGGRVRLQACLQVGAARQGPRERLERLQPGSEGRV